MRGKSNDERTFFLSCVVPEGQGVFPYPRSNQSNRTNRMDICEGWKNRDGYDPKQIDGRYAMVKPRYTATNLMPKVTSCTCWDP